MTGVAYWDAASDELSPAVLAQLLDLGHACWPDGAFTADDLDHAMGGRHFLAEADGRVVAHAAVVPRLLDVAGRSLRTGYVEAVATLPSLQGQGIATRLMTVANALIGSTYELGALSTSRHAFYERLGWRHWTGPTFVRELDGTLTRTEDEDDGIMWRSTRATPPGLTGSEAIACPWRPGDAW